MKTIESISFRYVKSVYFFVFIFTSALLLSACSHIGSKSFQESRAPITEKKVAFHAQRDDIQEAYKNFTLASLALSRGLYEEALIYLSTAVEKNPESVYLHTKMAMLLKKMKKFQEALAHALKCVELDPEGMRCHILLADAYALTGKDDLATEEYEKALSLIHI